MKPVFVGILIMVQLPALGQPTPARPKITGIDHVAFYTTAPDKNEHLYATVLGLRAASPVEPGQTIRFMVGSQWVGYRPARDAKATNRMDHVAFRTSNCEALRTYLAAQGVKVPGTVNTSKEGIRTFSIQDPEAHAIEFVEGSGEKLVKATTVGSTEPVATSDVVSRRLIHTGFIVGDRAAEDRFYQGILGFHLYWQGGMEPGHTDWVAMQVPDGTDWLEYMLNVKPDPDQRLTGIVNHISLGVKDMKAAQAKLERHGWKPTQAEHAQMGKDGKWQLNLYDPDMTRIELMEFTPAGKPCCSPFQGPHPHE